jgi:broad specificity phosphatase PhoE
VPAVTEILLVRHGQSTWNAQRRWQGQANPPLSEEGARQARAAARRVGAVDGLVSSPLSRAHHTARLIGEEVGVGPVAVVDGLLERSCGEWSGLTAEEIEARYPGDIAARRWPPGWEPDHEVAERALAALAAVVEAFHGGRALAVSHGGLMRCVLEALAHEPAPFRNLSGLVLRAEGARLRLLGAVDLLGAAPGVPPAAPRPLGPGDRDDLGDGDTAGAGRR